MKKPRKKTSYFSLLISLVVLVLISISCSSVKTGTVTDYDGNVYKTIILDDDEYMAENLKVTHYSDGTPIKVVTDFNDWDYSTNKQMLCYYNFNSNGEKDEYGALYTWDAATRGSTESYNVQGVCPDGWHIPNQFDFFDLKDDATGKMPDIAGIVLKDTAGWDNDGNGTNSIGFTGKPAGFLSKNLEFVGMGDRTGYWTIKQYEESVMAMAYILKSQSSTFGYVKAYKYAGISVRCIKNRK